MTQDHELDVLAARILKSPDFRCAPQRAALFKYLWNQRAERSKLVDIWEGALQPGSGSDDKDQPIEDYDYRDSVRQSCTDLRNALDRYFNSIAYGWKIKLPPANGHGYQLDWKKVNDPQTAVRAFWRVHLDCPRDVAVVYIEQLFFQCWPKRLTFRYYDCNEEHKKQALAELKERHLDAYEAHKNDGLNAAYPYVAWGEIEARDLITRWFADHAMVEVNPVIPRQLKDDAPIWAHSLILLGAAPGNRFIVEFLQRCPELAFSLEEGATVNGRCCGRVTVKNPTEDEMQRFARARYNPVRTDLGCTLDFSPDWGKVLAILTRVPNPDADTPVTILNADYGRAVEQMAALLTDEERMRTGKELPTSLLESDSFQILFAVPIFDLTTENRRTKLELLAWRPHAL